MLSRLIVLPMLRMLNRLAVDTASRVGGSLGVLTFHLRIRRRVANQVITTALGLRGRARRRVIRRSYASMGATFLELWTVGGVDGPEHHLRHLNPQWTAALHRRHPASVLLTGHIGNWDLAAHSELAYSSQFLVYAKAQHNPTVDVATNRQRARLGTTILMAEHGDKKSALQVMRGLRDGHPVGLMADQAPGSREGVPGYFFGQPTYCHAGPGFFAKRGRVPIVPGLCVRVRAGQFIMVMGRAIPTDGANEATLNQAAMDALCAMIAAVPGQYFWQHRRFKDRLDLPMRANEPWRTFGFRLLAEPLSNVKHSRVRGSI